MYKYILEQWISLIVCTSMYKYILLHARFIELCSVIYQYILACTSTYAYKSQQSVLFQKKKVAVRSWTRDHLHTFAELTPTLLDTDLNAGMNDMSLSRYIYIVSVTRLVSDCLCTWCLMTKRQRLSSSATAIEHSWVAWIHAVGETYLWALCAKTVTCSGQCYLWLIWDVSCACRVHCNRGQRYMIPNF